MPKMLAFLLIVILFLFFWQRRTWVGDSKLTLAVNDRNRVLLGVFDPQTSEITTIIIPGSTQVDVSRRLGEMRVSSVWKLGQDENLMGRLLSETITKNFRIPTNYWADGFASGFLGKGSIFSALFRKYRTNLSFSDRLRLFFFSLKVKEFKRTEIDLSKTTFLKEKKLIDGEMGYVVNELVPQRIMILASDNLIVKRDLKILLTNATGDVNISEDIGRIIEAMGTKIASVENTKKEEIDCVVTGEDKEIVKRFVLLFGCQPKTGRGNFDIEFKFGTKFADRF